MTNDYPVSQRCLGGYQQGSKINHQERPNYSAVEGVKVGRAHHVEEEVQGNQGDDMEVCVGALCSCASE